MPDARLQKCRDSYESDLLYRGRRVGELSADEAREACRELIRRYAPAITRWRAPHENAAEQLDREAKRFLTACDPGDEDVAQ